MSLYRSRPAPRRRQGGVTLVVAMIMLLVIGVASVALMRASLNTDQVANNSRVQTLARESAQVALRYCETQMELPAAARDAGFAISGTATTPATLWSSLSNWRGAGKVSFAVPVAAMQSANSSFVPTVLPECLAEFDNSAAPAASVVITARGFSPDYAEDAQGHVTAGSVVWLQSISRVN